MKSQYLTTSEMQALEHHAVEKYSISLDQMMQNAGRAVFDVVMNEVLPQFRPTKSSEGGQSLVHMNDLRILVVCGKGNNGGDALVTAELLYEKGIDVAVLNLYPISDMSPMAKTEMMKCKKLGIKFVGNFDSNYSLIIDGIFGFSLKGNPRLPEAKIIEQINYSGIKILSIDVPSGLDAHNGSIGNPTIKADYTIALGLPKIGFKKHLEIIGKLYVGDLGIPEKAYRDMGYEPPMFRGKSYISVN
jgi:NAD(P)H-hydrate epimerase